MLPILETPKFEVTIPSSKKLVEFRPYLVKEEKILMIALESDDERQMLRAMKEVIRVCTFDKVNPDDLAIFDLEYLFLKLRAKSVGESVTIQLKCKACEAFTETDINIDEVEVKFPNGKDIKKSIWLTENVGITLRPISIKGLSRLNLSDSLDKTGRIMELLAASIETVFDREKVYPIEDVSSEEIMAFIDSLNRAQLTKIEEFVASLPKLEKEVKFACTKCASKNEVTLSGIQSFFA